MLHYELEYPPKGIQITPIRVVPKKNKPGKWTDLSSSEGSSVNDAISTEHSSLKYPSIDHLSLLVLESTSTPYLVKADIHQCVQMTNCF